MLRMLLEGCRSAGQGNGAAIVQVSREQHVLHKTVVFVSTVRDLING